MKPKKILINYANEAFRESQILNSKTGLEVGGFDKVIEYSPKDIDKKFYEKNKHILTQMRGAGYWLWKPYMILKTLNRKDVKFGDYIFYSDSGAYFIDSIDHLIPLCKKYRQDIIVFSRKNHLIERNWVKRDALILMDMDREEVLNSAQVGATFILIKKSKFSVNFFEEFLHYAQDERIITDSPSTLGKEHKGFKENRHDQSIFSLLCKKYNLRYFRFPFQDGNEIVHLFEDKYPQILVLTRKHKRGLIDAIKYQKSCSKNLFHFICNLIVVPIRKIYRTLFKDGNRA